MLAAPGMSVSPERAAKDLVRAIEAKRSFVRLVIDGATGLADDVVLKKPVAMAGGWPSSPPRRRAERGRATMTGRIREPEILHRIPEDRARHGTPGNPRTLGLEADAADHVKVCWMREGPACHARAFDR